MMRNVKKSELELFGDFMRVILLLGLVWMTIYLFIINQNNSKVRNLGDSGLYWVAEELVISFNELVLPIRKFSFGWFYCLD